MLWFCISKWLLWFFILWKDPLSLQVFPGTAQQNSICCISGKVWQLQWTHCQALSTKDGPAYSLLFLHHHIEMFCCRRNSKSSMYAKDKDDGWTISQGLMETWFQVWKELLWSCCCWTSIKCLWLSCLCMDTATDCLLWIVKTHESFYSHHTKVLVLHYSWPICFNMQNMRISMQNMKRNIQNMQWYMQNVQKRKW